jgi:CheY-like chemotaxis protein
VAESWEEAMALAKRFGPVGVVTDSDQQDIAALQEWQESCKECALPILGCPMPSGRRVAKEQGIDDLLVKPIRKQDLVRAFRALSPVNTILIAEFEPDMARLLERMLRHFLPQARLIKAYHREELLDLVSREKPEVILLDVSMIEQEVESTLAAIRGHYEEGCVTIIATSNQKCFEALIPSNRRHFFLLLPQTLGPLRTVQYVQRLCRLSKPPFQ